MSITAQCETCGEAFEAPREAAGLMRPCAICGAENRIPRRSVHTSDDYTSEEVESLRLVGRGIGLILLAITIYLLYAILALLGIAVVGEPLVRVLQALAPVVVIACPLLVVVGDVLCLFVPPRSRAKGMVVASVALQAIAVLASLWFFVGLFANVGRVNFDNLLFAVGVLQLSFWCQIVGQILFVLFMARLALFLNQPETSRKAMSVLWLGLACIVLVVVGSLFGPGRDLVPGIVIGLTLLVSVLVAFLQFVGALSQLRKGIRAIA